MKCGAGSIMARERATLALARMFTDYPIPLTVVTNSEDASPVEYLERGNPGMQYRGHFWKRGSSLIVWEGAVLCVSPGKTPEDGKADLIGL